MSMNFGAIRQLGYVVRDLDAAMADWAARLGIGPWFVNRAIGFGDTFYRGQARPGPTISYALANSGDMQIELIEQMCDTPSVYRDHLARHGEGLHHLCVWPEDYDGAYVRALAAGLVPAQEGRFGKIRFAYFEEVGHGGTSLEMSELVPSRLPVIRHICDSAAEWDGTDPVRPYPRLPATRSGESAG
jgi:hypothetical protein